ncbi:MAG: FtsX-like permease family protein [Alkalilacustris sp.]
MTAGGRGARRLGTLDRVVLGALLSHWRAHPLQLAMLLIGLALATALFTGVQAINAEARASYAQAAAVLGQDQLSRLVPAEGAASLPQADYVALRRAGWLVSPVVEARATIAGQRVTVLGIDPLTAPPQAGVAALAEAEALADFVTPPGTRLAAPETAARLPGVDPAEGLPPGTVLMDVGIAQSLAGLEGQLTRLLLWPTQPQGLAPLGDIAPALRLEAPDSAADLGRLTDSFHLNLTAFGFLAFAVGLFIVNAAVGLAFEQRRGMFRTLRALGVPAGRLTGALLAELLVLAALAGAAGVVLGYGLAALLLPDVAATLRGLYGAPVAGRLAVRPEWWAVGLAIALGGTMVAGARSLWRVWRLPVLAPAQPRAWARASEAALAGQAAASVGLGLGALALGVWGSGLAAGFLLLACALVAAALALPVLLTALLGAAQTRVRGVLGQWFLADTRQQLPGLSLALMALMLALAANVGVGTMVASFRLTFTGWLDQRLAAEVYVSARDAAEAEALRDWLAPRSDAILPIWNVEGTISGQPGTVFGVKDHATYRDHWPLLQAQGDVWDRVAAGTGVLVNEQGARRLGLRLGDRVTLPRGLQLPLVGVYSDYGNPQAQAIVGLETFLDTFPDAPRLAHAVRVDPARAADLVTALVDDFGAAPDRVTDQAQAKAFSLEVFERTFAVTAALNILTLAVAAVALLASLVTLAGMRLGQLAPVWAVGLTRRRLAVLELARTVLLAALTAMAAVPVGLGLAWILLAVINVDAFGWRLPMRVFPADWARLAAAALAAGLLAAAWPAARLARLAPTDLLRVFARER